MKANIKTSHNGTKATQRAWASGAIPIQTSEPAKAVIDNVLASEFNQLVQKKPLQLIRKTRPVSRLINKTRQVRLEEQIREQLKYNLPISLETTRGYEIMVKPNEGVLLYTTPRQVGIPNENIEPIIVDGDAEILHSSPKYLDQEVIEGKYQNIVKYPTKGLRSLAKDAYNKHGKLKREGDILAKDLLEVYDTVMANYTS
jgi:hypothetical protein